MVSKILIKKKAEVSQSHVPVLEDVSWVRALRFFVLFLPLSYLGLLLLRIKSLNTPFLYISYGQVNNILTYSSMSFSQILHFSEVSSFSLIDYIISLFNFSDGNSILFILPIVSMIFLIINLFLFDKLMAHFKVNFPSRIMSLFLVAITPVFISNIFILSGSLISLTLLMVAIFLKINKKHKLSLFFIVLSIFFWPAMIIFALFYFYHSFREKRDNKFLFKVNIFVSLFSFLVYYFMFIFPNILFSRDFFSSHVFFTKFVAEFGNFFGYGLPILFLSLFGFVVSWFYNKKQFISYVFLFSVFLLSTYFNSLILPLSFFVAFWCSRAIIFLNGKKWDLFALKRMTFFIIAYLMLFSVLFFVTNISEAGPSQEKVDSIKWMSSNLDEGIVLSSSVNTPLIKYFSNNNVFLDESRVFDKNNLMKVVDLNSVFYSRSLETTEGILKKYGVDYLFIDVEMKSGDIWTNKDQGLLFLLKNSEMFKNIYNSQGIEVWEYLG